MGESAVLLEGAAPAEYADGCLHFPGLSLRREQE